MSQLYRRNEKADLSSTSTDSGRLYPYLFDDDEQTDVDAESSGDSSARSGRRSCSPMSKSMEEQEDTGGEDSSDHDGAYFDTLRERIWEFYLESASKVEKFRTLNLIGCLHALLFAVCLITLVYIASFLFPLFASFRKPSPFVEEKSLNNFQHELREMLIRVYKLETNTLERMLNYVVERMLRRECGLSRTPLILLVAGRDRDVVGRLVQLYITLISHYWPRYGRIELVSNAATTKYDLDSALLTPLNRVEEPTGFVLVLHEINQLRGASPLFLQDFADPDSSPLLSIQKNVLTVASLELEPPNSTGGAESCEERISSSLFANWKSAHLSYDQIAPIVARLGALSICLD